MPFPRKLNAEAVRDIRRWHARHFTQREMSVAQKAAQYGICEETVRRIALWHCYKDVRN